jgi:hypothetical protein
MTRKLRFDNEDEANILNAINDTKEQLEKVVKYAKGLQSDFVIEDNGVIEEAEEQIKMIDEYILTITDFDS